jgi:kumamolisin
MSETDRAVATADVNINNGFPARIIHRPYIKFPKSATAASAAKPWDVPALCHAYGWPTDLAGGGVIAIVELGGGWTQPDLTEFCETNNIPVPSVTDVSVDGTRNAPGVDADPDGEVALDIQVAATAYSVATGKPATIRVYWAADIAPAVRAALADGCDVCSISWGADEAEWGLTAARDMEQAAAAAVAGGMVIFAAAGDNDSSDGGPNAANVDAPASCPHVIACGGTRKTATTETVWNNKPGQTSGEGTGGGFSTVFPPVDWQIGVPHGPGRMVPDVAANADPETGYQIVVDGQVAQTGGTSAVAPGCSPRSAPNSAGCRRSCGVCRFASTTSPWVTTARSGPDQGRMRAPDWARPWPNDWRPCWPTRPPARGRQEQSRLRWISRRAAWPADFGGVISGGGPGQVVRRRW